MSFIEIDLEKYPRRDHFDYFRTMAYPYVGVTVEVDVTEFVGAQKREGFPFFLSLLYCVGQAANCVSQFRQRIVGDTLIEYDRCDTSHVVMHEDETYSYCRLDCMKPFEEFLPEAVRKHEAAKTEPTELDDSDQLDLLYISCVPWMHFTSVTHPVPDRADSIPRITLGKYDVVNGRAKLPVSVQANHAVVDGLHLGRFFEELETRMQLFAQERSREEKE